ncbi:MAG: riboflavin kinase, partial [Bacteroidota bacterium]
ANQFLGDEFTLNGKVVHGDQLGRKIGFPTANLELSSKDKLIPALGAYAVMVRIREEMLSGMMNIGIRPTVSHENTVRIELNIFDFNSDIYGEQLEVYLLKRIRGEKKFSSIEELKDQLQLDESIVRNYILSERF